ncbi:hypothetical protein [Arthrobacter monumenti]
MSNSAPDPLDPDAPEADVLEQRRAAVWEDEADRRRGIPAEANEADVAEQNLDVDDDDDEYPRDG